jgi:diadenylate cyclase
MSSNLVQQFHIFLQNVGWRDVVDVAICSVLVYQLLKLIRGTQAVQILVGLALLVILAALAQTLHLRLLDFIFANAGQAIVIAVVVLFAPELRRALDQMGRLGAMRSLRGHSAIADTGHVVDEVLRASQTLSERKHGALVVFERGTGLQNLAATGVPINGDVTAEMITALFFPNSPLHDGAVIIKNNRIGAAGCVLPLADAVPGRSRMGTRHRAASGLTTQSDAVIVVVSEETGLISLAYDGVLYRGLAKEALQSRLVALLGSRTGGGKLWPTVRPRMRATPAKTVGDKTRP